MTSVHHLSLSSKPNPAKVRKEMDDFSFPAVHTECNSANCDFPFDWFYRKSFSSAEEATKVVVYRSAVSDDEEAHDRSVQSEEKMDMLWEDFNEEKDFCEWNRDLKRRVGGTVARASDVKFGVTRRRPGVVAMVKVLKKLFLVRKRGSKKRGPPSAPIYKT